MLNQQEKPKGNCHKYTASVVIHEEEPVISDCFKTWIMILSTLSKISIFEKFVEYIEE